MGGSGADGRGRHRALQVADGRQPFYARAPALEGVTAICDDKLRPFGVSSTQFALLIVSLRLQIEVGRPGF